MMFDFPLDPVVCCLTLVAADVPADSFQASATAQPEAEYKNYCHTFFGTLHHAPSGAICRAPADTRYLGIASEFI